MPDLTGTVLGKYELIERLGSGGMSDVYKAFQPGPDRYVAVKVLQTQWAHDKDFVRRFKREAQAVARLRHPNIIQLHDFDVAADMFYMVMEYVEGDTLFDRLALAAAHGECLPLPEITRVLDAIAGALDEAHDEGVIHRDLKPSNVIFTEDDEPILADFGIARVAGADHHTRSGTILGTASYMSPEQIKGEAVDGRSDIYALGVMLYEMVTGQVPFSGTTSTAVIIKHINESPAPPRTLNPDVPLAAQAVILRALAKDPAQRPASAGALVEAWRAAVPEAPPEIVGAETVQLSEEATLPPVAAASRPVAATPLRTAKTPTQMPPPQDTFLSVGASRLVLPLAVGALLMLTLALIDLLQKLDPDLLTVIGVVVGLFSTLVFEFGEQLFGKNFSRQVAIRLAALGAFIQRGIMVLSVLVILASLSILIVPRVFKEDPVALNNRGVELMLAGQTSEALSVFREAIALDSEYAMAHYHLGWAYESLFNYEDAIDAYLLALEKDSALDVAYNNLARLYILEQDYDRAVAILKQAEHNVADAQRYVVYKNMGWAYLGKADYQEALGYLQFALAMQEDFADTHYLLGELYLAQSEPALAKASYERFLNLADAEYHAEWIKTARLKLEQMGE